MAVEIKHSTLTTKPDDPSYDVSADEWNEAHAITGLGTAAEADTTDFTAAAHATDTANPHSVTATQVGLGNVDNTSDADKPVSTAQATADNLRVLKTGDTMTGTLTNTKSASGFGGDYSSYVINNSTTALLGVNRGLDINMTNTSSVGTCYGVDINVNGSTLNTTSTGVKVSGDPLRGIELTSTGGWEQSAIHVTANSLTGGVNGSPEVLSINSSTTVYSNAAIGVNYTAVAPNALFMRFNNPDGTAFSVDSTGNMQISGAYIHPSGTIGKTKNLAFYSEQLDQVSKWTPTNTTVAQDIIDGPDGRSLVADRMTTTNSSNSMIQSFTTETAANNTFTVSLWGRRTAAQASTLRFAIEDSTASESSEVIHIGLTGDEDKWFYAKATVTFTGAATGSPRLNMWTVNSGSVYYVTGVNFTDTDHAVGYSPTQNYQNAESFGTVTNGTLQLMSGDGPTQFIQTAGDSQSTNDLVQINDNTNTTKVKIKSDFGLEGVGALFTGDLEVDGALNHDGTTAGFFNTAPVTKPTALTAANATALDGTIATNDTVTDNIRTRLNELETKLQALGLLT